MPVEAEELRRLDQRARLVLALFTQAEQITTAQVAEALGLSNRMARVLLKQWTEDGWLMMAKASRRKRAFTLSAKYRQFIGNVSAIARGTSSAEQARR